MGDFEDAETAAKTEGPRQPAPKRSLQETFNDGDLEGDVMVTNETELPAVLQRDAPVHASAGVAAAAPPAKGFLDDLIASIAADKVESDRKFADFESKFEQFEKVLRGMDEARKADQLATNAKLDRLLAVVAAQQSGGKLGQSKGQTGTIHGKTRKGGRSPARARSPPARSRSRSSASDDDAAGETPR